MIRALELAREAAAAGEIPVGAVLVKNGEILSEGRNRREETGNTLAHAEIEAIDRACKRLRDWRLDGCTLYVTLEPCPMCAGAILNARIEEVVFGAYDLRAGCFDSVLNLTQYPFESHPQIKGGICEDDCRAVLTEFFQQVRHEK